MLIKAITRAPKAPIAEASVGVAIPANIEPSTRKIKIIGSANVLNNSIFSTDSSFKLTFIFLLGFILDFIEICYVIVPLVAPPLLMMGFDPVWLAILFAINLQTSFLTPPFGFSLFYLRGVADENIQTIEIYKGVVPFIVIQLLVLFLILFVPSLLI